MEFIYSQIDSYSKILDDYEEFLKINDGFIHVAKASDLKLPTGVKEISSVDEPTLLAKVEEVIESGNFKSMIDSYQMVK